MKSRWILALVGCAVAGAGCTGPQGVHDHAAMKAAPTAPAQAAAPADAGTAENIGCPVTGEKFQPTADTPRSTYNGKTYYFCCAGCKVMFDKNPQEYVK